MTFCPDCPAPDMCNPPLHNLLVCCGTGPCDPRCPVETWRSTHNRHTRYVDDGAAYCGFPTDYAVIDGCGRAWPCPTAQDARPMTAHTAQITGTPAGTIAWVCTCGVEGGTVTVDDAMSQVDTHQQEGGR